MTPGVLGRSLTGAAVLALLAAGCGGGDAGDRPSGGASATPPASVTGSSGAQASPCPSASAAASGSWPVGVPADLPRPPGLAVTSAQPPAAGQREVRFTTTAPLRGAVRFFVSALPAAGYTLGDGEIERSEAEVAFRRGALRGNLKLLVQGPCLTAGVLALAQTAVPGGVTPRPSPG